MSKIKFFKYSTWGLLLLNIAILAFFLFRGPSHLHPGHGTRNFLSAVTEILDLDRDQENQFLKLAKEHKEKMDELNGKQSSLLLTYFGSLTNSNMEDNSDEGLEPLQKLQSDKLKVTYEHLLDIKKFLKKDQLPQFDTFMSEFTDRVMINKDANRPPVHK